MKLFAGTREFDVAQAFSRVLTFNLIALTLLAMIGSSTAHGEGDAEEPHGPDTVLTTAIHGTLGPYLADGDGRPLYLREPSDHGQVDCGQSCFRIWPPLIASSSPSVGDPSLEPSLIDVLTREDGSRQVTYNGHPLHYHARDLADEAGWQGPLGQAIYDEWGGWFLVSPDGEKLEGLIHVPQLP